MKAQIKIRESALLLFVMVIAGCATIVGDTTQGVPISSEPSGAAFTITDESGKEVARGTTPTTITLDKSTGQYWGGKTYKVTLSSPGTKDQTIDVKASPNGWYIAGNIVFGGLIGWFIVDPWSGKMYTLNPKEVSWKIGQKEGLDDGDGGAKLRVAYINEVPEALRDRLVELK